MREKITAEMAGLEQKIVELKQELVLTDGALQAFRWVLAELDKTTPTVVDEHTEEVWR